MRHHAHHVSSPLAWPPLAMAMVASTIAMVAPTGRLAAGELQVACHWIGNSFPGIGENGKGEWMQDMIDQIAVSPDGTVITTSSWDEAGRCSGLYREGHVNRSCLQQSKGSRKAWGWGTAGNGIAVDADRFLILNTEGELLRFSWRPGELDSAEQLDQLAIGKGRCVAMRGGTVALVLDGDVVALLSASDLKERQRFTLAGVTRVAISGDGSLWLLAGGRVIHRSPDGGERPETIIDAGQPTAISIDPWGRLVVCDNGSRQQVLIYDISAQPRLISRFGDEGGIAAGTPGRAAPGKLYGLRGADFDSAGNLYVALCLGPLQGAGTCLRSFDPAGRLRWELQGLAFVNCYDVDPASDGHVLYGLHEIIDFDPAKPAGLSWKLRSISCDPIGQPADPRAKDPTGGITMRTLKGRRTLFSFGQMAGGPTIFAFPDEHSDIAVPVGKFKDGGWASSVDAEGSIWWGDGPGKVIRRWAFKGWKADGSPDYDVAHPDTFPVPSDFTAVCRVLYDPPSDSLYIGGNTMARPERSWGLIGTELARYDGWMSGKRGKRWQIALPSDDDRLTPKSIDLAGAYLFTVFVKNSGGRPSLVTVLKAGDGAMVGTMAPGPEVGGASGWVDMTHGLRAFHCRDGTYMVVVEEDARAKNLVYRWQPKG